MGSHPATHTWGKKTKKCVGVDAGLLVRNDIIHLFPVLIQQDVALLLPNPSAILPPVQDSVCRALLLGGSTLECFWLCFKIILEAVNLEK